MFKGSHIFIPVYRKFQKEFHNNSNESKASSNFYSLRFSRKTTSRMTKFFVERSAFLCTNSSPLQFCVVIIVVEPYLEVARLLRTGKCVDWYVRSEEYLSSFDNFHST